MLCPVCNITLSSNTSLANEHINNHFTDSEPLIHEKLVVDGISTINFFGDPAVLNCNDFEVKQWENTDEISLQASESSINAEIVKLRVLDGSALVSSIYTAKMLGFMEENIYCQPSCDHYSIITYDRGWGCGYRNIQMLSSSLLRINLFKGKLFEGLGKVPDICSIQHFIEQAWAKGLDSLSASQLEREVKYTRKWIGAAECCTLMNYFDIPARIRNFVKSSNGDHVKEMFNFIWNHFSHPITIQQNKVSKASSEQSLYSSKFNEMRLPIYLQYDGHSITVIGIEKTKQNELQLIIFDPSWRTSTVRQAISERKMRLFRRKPNQFPAKEYQLVIIDSL